MADNSSQDWLRYISVGTEFAVAFGAPVAVGVLVDRWRGTMPAFTLVGAVVGFAAAIYQMVRLNQRLQARGRQGRKPGDSDGRGDDAKG